MFSSLYQQLAHALLPFPAIVRHIREGQQHINELQEQFPQLLEKLQHAQTKEDFEHQFQTLVDTEEMGQEQVIASLNDDMVLEERLEDDVTVRHFSKILNQLEKDVRDPRLKQLIKQCEQRLRAMYTLMFKELAQEFNAVQEVVQGDEVASMQNRAHGIALVMRANRAAWNLKKERRTTRHDVQAFEKLGEHLKEDIAQYTKRGEDNDRARMEDDAAQLEKTVRDLVEHVTQAFGYYTLLVRVLVGQFFIFRDDERLLDAYLDKLATQKLLRKDIFENMKKALHEKDAPRHKQAVALAHFVVNQRHSIQAGQRL